MKMVQVCPANRLYAQIPAFPIPDGIRISPAQAGLPLRRFVPYPLHAIQRLAYDGVPWVARRQKLKIVPAVLVAGD
jgi:hypothetical protein